MGGVQSNTVIENKESDEERDLIFNDHLIRRLTKMHSAEVVDLVPRLAYWSITNEKHRKMRYSENIVGHQQRAFDFYWTFRILQLGNVMLGIGCGGVGAAGQLTTDKFNGESPNQQRYGDSYAFSALKLDADSVPWIFHDGKLGGVMFNHSFEHLNNQEGALQEALRVTKQDGYVCIIMPDMTFNSRGRLDPTHTREFTADEFYEWVEEIRERLPKFEWVEQNTFDNGFSFNSVLKRLD